MLYFLPTLDLSDPKLRRIVVCGQLRLQRGQWIKMSPAEKPTRFIGVTRTGEILHERDRARFKELCALIRDNNLS